MLIGTNFRERPEDKERDALTKCSDDEHGATSVPIYREDSEDAADHCHYVLKSSQEIGLYWISITGIQGQMIPTLCGLNPAIRNNVGA